MGTYYLATLLFKIYFKVSIVGQTVFLPIMNALT